MDEPIACSDIEMSAFCVLQLRQGLTDLWQEFAYCVANPRPGSDKPIHSHGLDKIDHVRHRAEFVGLMCEKSIPTFRRLMVDPRKLNAMRNAAQVLDLDRMAVDYLDLVNEVDTCIPLVSRMLPIERQKTVAKAVLRELAEWSKLPKDIQESCWANSLMSEQLPETLVVIGSDVPGTIESSNDTPLAISNSARSNTVGKGAYHIDVENRTLSWFGRQFMTIDPNPFRVIEILYAAFEKGHGPVTLDSIRTKVPHIFTINDNGLAEVFTKRVLENGHRRRKKIEVWSIIRNSGPRNAPAYELERPPPIPG